MLISFALLRAAFKGATNGVGFGVELRTSIRSSCQRKFRAAPCDLCAWKTDGK